jgi:hypothetical protein
MVLVWRCRDAVRRRCVCGLAFISCSAAACFTQIKAAASVAQVTLSVKEVTAVPKGVSSPFGTVRRR